MKTAIKKFLESEVSKRVFKTGEHDQAVIRLAIVSCIVVYVFWAFWDATVGTMLLNLAVQLSLGGLVFSVVMLVWSSRIANLDPTNFSKVACRIAGMVHDLGFPSWGLVVFGQEVAPLYFIYLWVTFGNGIRYGLTYLHLAMGLSIVGFTTVLVLNPYWHENLRLGIGLLLALAILPLYVSKLIRTLNASLHALEQANEAKTRFIANMSHELRTPLNSVIAVSDLIAEKPLGGELRSMVGMVQSSARAQLDLINQVLDISKIESAKVNLEEQPFHLHRVIHETVEIIWPQARVKNLHLHTYIDSKVPFSLIGSAAHLRQVLINLCGNGTKFTDHGRVDLRVWRKAESSHSVSLAFEISDTGIGIPESAQVHIFEPFAQADDSITRRFGGTGLGTTISRQLVELMGGQIACESTEGVGTTFTIDLEFTKGACIEPTDKIKDLRLLALGCSGLKDTLDMCCPKNNVHIDYIYDTDKLAEQLDQPIPYSALLINVSHYGRFATRILQHLNIDSTNNMPIIGLGKASNVTLLADAGYTTLVDPQDLHGVETALHIASVWSVNKEPEKTQTAATGRRLSILVADDQETNREVARMILEGAGHKIDLANDGEDALDMLEANTYDLAILDMHMPNVSGIDVAKVHRFADTKASIPIILLTADVTQDAIRQSEEAGIERFLTKPIQPRDLLKVVHEVTGKINPDEYQDHVIKPSSTNYGTILDENKLAELERMSPNGRRFVVDVIDGFIRDGDALIKNLKQALLVGDYRQLLDTAHALKGCAVSVGAGAVYAHTVALNKLKPAEVPVDGPSLVDHLAKDWVATKKACMEFIAGGSSSASA